MPTSATGKTEHVVLRGEAGYTLVEALTTLVIVGLVASAVMILAPGPDRTTGRFAEGMAARIAAASEESIIVNRPLGLFVTAEGYGFALLEATGWRQSAPASPLAFRPWPDGVAASVERAGAEDASREDGLAARFDALGGATPARIVLSGDGVRWIVTIDGQGRAHVERAR
jgi:general secretion pathway protein H